MCCRWSRQASAPLRRRTEAVVAAVSGAAAVAAQLSAVAVALEAVAVVRLSAAVVAALEVAVAPRLSAAALEAAAWPLRRAVAAVLGLAPLLADLA